MKSVQISWLTSLYQMIYTNPSGINSSSGVENFCLPTNIAFVHISSSVNLSLAAFESLVKLGPILASIVLFQNHNLYNYHNSTIMCMLTKRTRTILRSPRFFYEISVFVEFVAIEFDYQSRRSYSLKLPCYSAQYWLGWIFLFFPVLPLLVWGKAWIC
jgi:hypothetical protein